MRIIPNFRQSFIGVCNDMSVSALLFDIYNQHFDSMDLKIMTSEDRIFDARRHYEQFPDFAFSLILDVLEAQNKTIGHLIAWSADTLGEKAARDLLDMLNDK